MSIELAQRIFGTPGTMGLSVLAVLSALLFAAAWSDLRRRRIPNAVVFPGTLLAVLLHAVLPAGDGFIGFIPGGLGAWSAIQGMACGLLAMLPLYITRSMGAGDVKLMAMVGAFLGPVQIWSVLYATVLAGGVLAVVVALHQGVLLRALNNVRLMLFGRLIAMIRARRSKTADAEELVQIYAPSPIGTMSTARLPYAVAIAGGSIAYLLYHARLAGIY